MISRPRQRYQRQRNRSNNEDQATSAKVNACSGESFREVVVERKRVRAASPSSTGHPCWIWKVVMIQGLNHGLWFSSEPSIQWPVISR